MLCSVSGILPSPVFMGIKETWQLNVRRKIETEQGQFNLFE